MKKNGYFGTCVDGTLLTDSQHQRYQEVFYKHFTWGVLENDLKWKWMEETQVEHLIFCLYVTTHKSHI